MKPSLMCSGLFRLADRTRAFLAVPPEDACTSTLRAVRLAAIDKFVPIVMLANVAVSTALTALLYKGHEVILPIWCAVVSAASLVRTLQSRRAKGRPRQKAARSAGVRSVVQAVAMALVSAGVPAWLLDHTSGVAFAIVVCHLTGSLWAGVLVLSTAIPAAVAYASTMVLLVDGWLVVADSDSEHVFLAALVCLSAVTALRSAVELSHLFATDYRQKLDLERQSEVIGILLKDYEEQTSDWLWEFDPRGCFRNPSARLAQVMALTPERLAGQRYQTLLTQPTTPGNLEALAEIHEHGIARRPYRDIVLPVVVAGELRWWAVSGRPCFDVEGQFTGYRGVTTDITTARIAQQRISHLAHHDALTDLPNRASFRETLQSALTHPDRSRLVILSIDLDGFKPVNDRHGHPVGDALLIMVADRLRIEVQPEDVVARFGGDEFLVLHERPAGVSAVEALCRRLVEALAQPFEVGDERITVRIGISIGVAFAPSDGRTPDDLIRNADAALYRAKSDGRGTFCFFEPEMDRRLQDRQQLVHDLRVALANGEFELHFQPFIGAGDGAVTGCEALLRWHHPVRGMVSPTEFVPLAEENRLIAPIGDWVIRQACLQAARWPSGQRVSVNISPVQFRERSLPRTILAALAEAGLSPDRLEVEVTETVLIDDSDGALDILRQIKAMGVRIALDDFGTGYASLSYLRCFPFDKVKIDKSFVKDLVSRHDNQIIVQAVRDLAKGLGMSITAEGVETEEQADRLRQTGCEELQGYLFSRPVPSDQYAKMFAMSASTAA